MQTDPLSFQPAVQDEIERSLTIFDAASALRIEAPSLLPARKMLDLYGESIRNRAYVVHDPIDGDFVLRPDFTMPVVEAHMEHGAEPARYAYSGRVWRRGQTHSRRKHSFWQTGFELFDHGDPAQNDAEIFALAIEVAKPHEVSPRTGDLGIMFDALDKLIDEDWRRNALKRHVWRPRAFSRLLDRYVTSGGKYPDLALNDAPKIGMRTKAMINARIERLRTEAEAPPLGIPLVHLFARLGELSGDLLQVEKELRELVTEWPQLVAIADRVLERNEALVGHGIDPSKIGFASAYGRETMEYYDGFVFGFFGGGSQPVISGGRYDQLTSILGAGRQIPAIGIAYRPELIVGDQA